MTENSRASRLTLRIVPGGRALKITTPPHVSETEIDRFLTRHRNWVEARIDRLPEHVEIDEGAMVPYLGVDRVIVHLDRLRGVVELRDVGGKPALLVPGEPGQVGRKVVSFMKQQARLRLNEAVDRHARTLGVRPKSIRITDTTSRWGSCSTTRVLSFSWRIVMAPPQVLDYLAAHEVAHLREMNHSPAFWALVRQICPQMETQKSWLKRHGARLHTIDPA